MELVQYTFQVKTLEWQTFSETEVDGVRLLDG